MINYDQAGGVSVAVSSLSNLSMKSVLTLRRIRQSQAELSTQGPRFRWRIMMLLTPALLCH